MCLTLTAGVSGWTCAGDGDGSSSHFSLCPQLPQGCSGLSGEGQSPLSTCLHSVCGFSPGYLLLPLPRRFCFHCLVVVLSVGKLKLLVQMLRTSSFGGSIPPDPLSSSHASTVLSIRLKSPKTTCSKQIYSVHTL